MLYGSLIISLLALGVSVWSVVQSREAALQSRRTEVREGIREMVAYSQRTYSDAVCLFSVAKGQEAEAALLAKDYAEAAKGLDVFRGTSDIIQKIGYDRLNLYEQMTEQSYSTYRELGDYVKTFKKHLTPEELQRYEQLCR